MIIRIIDPSLHKDYLEPQDYKTSIPQATMPAQTNIHDTIVECLQAQSDSAASQCTALQTLSSLTKVSSDNRNLVAQFPATLPTLLALSNSPSFCTASLSILFNLSLNTNLKRTLATPDTIRHLNSLILSPCSSQTGKLAASLICSLAMFDKNKAVFGINGTMEAVVRALQNTETATQPAAHHLLSSLVELAQFHGNCTMAVRAGAVPLLTGMLADPSNDLIGSSLAVLSLLARFEEGIGAIRAVHGVVGLVVDGLRRGCMMSRESSAEILEKLFEDSEECMREAAGNSEFCSLLADLSVRGSTKARDKAAVLMKMMMEADLDCYVEGSPIILR